MFDLQDFERNGFAVVPSVLSPGSVAELIAALDAIRPGGSALDRGGRVYASRNLMGEVPRVRELAGDAVARDLVARVLDPGAFAVRGLLFDKSAGANWMVPWHQDLSIAVRSRIDLDGFGPWTFKAGVTHAQPPARVLERMVTLRFQLDDGHEENGPLRVVPGSHRAGRLDVASTRDWLDRVGPVTCPVPSGGVLMLRPLLLHASSALEATSADSHRRVIHLEYSADALPAGLEWHDRVGGA